MLRTPRGSPAWACTPLSRGDILELSVEGELKSARSGQVEGNHIAKIKEVAQEMLLCEWVCEQFDVMSNLLLLAHWETRGEVGRGKETGCEKLCHAKELSSYMR